MPNTLVHIGLQGPASRALLRGIGWRWILLGCMLSDVAWILQRVLVRFASSDALYDLKLYGVVQSSLAATVLLAGAIAAVTRAPGRIFALLAVNSLAHLLLDACQIKPGNGVHLFAPVSWNLVSFDFVWPDHPLTTALTLLGLGTLLWIWRGRGEPSIGFHWSRGRIALSFLLLLGYFIAPLALLSGPEAADNHSIGSLRDRAGRPGRQVEFDRVPYVHREGGEDGIVTLAGEELRVRGVTHDRSTYVSARGTFLDQETITLTELHPAQTGARDLASYVALAFIALCWVWSIRGKTGPR